MSQNNINTSPKSKLATGAQALTDNTMAFQMGKEAGSDFVEMKYRTRPLISLTNKVFYPTSGIDYQAQATKTQTRE